jgi:hypothetical protein
MSNLDWTLVLILGISAAAIVLAGALLWAVAQGAWRLAQWLRG